MKKLKVLSISILITGLVAVIGLFTWFSLSFSACFGKNCTGTSLDTLLPYVILLMSLIIAPQAGYIYYKSRTGRRPQSLKWNIIITVSILVFLLTGALFAAPLQSRIRINNRASELEKVSFGVYVSPLAKSNNYRYLTEEEHTYPHYISIYTPVEGEIEISGGEFTLDLRSVIGDPPCNLREASSYLTAGSKKRTGLYRKEEKAVKCLRVNDFLILTATSPYDSRIYYTSHEVNGTILIFRSTAISNDTVFADAVDRYVNTLELLPNKGIIRQDLGR